MYAKRTRPKAYRRVKTGAYQTNERQRKRGVADILSQRLFPERTQRLIGSGLLNENRVAISRDASRGETRELIRPLRFGWTKRPRGRTTDIAE